MYYLYAVMVLAAALFQNQSLKRLQPLIGINAEVKHTAVGEMGSQSDWTDIIAISKKLAEGASFPADAHVIEVVNIMDGKGIAASIGKIVDEFYPEARKNQVVR